MTIREIEDYYRVKADYYVHEAEDFKRRGLTAEADKDFDSAVRLYMLSSMNYEKARLCLDFHNSLVEAEIIEACK